MIENRVYRMPGMERLRWRVHNERKSLCVAPDHGRGLVLVQCSAGLKLSKAKAMQLADLLVDAAEQLPD